MRPAEEYSPPAGRPVRLPAAVLTTFLVELVIVAAVGNQFVVDRLSKQLHGPLLKRGLLESLFTFYWRFSPSGPTDIGHFWLSRLLCAVAVVVLGPLLVALVVRGPVTFFRAFFSVLFAVVVATMLATFVRGLVADPRIYNSTDPQLGAAMFLPSGPDAPAFWGGLALGVVTGLVVAIVAVRTRRLPIADGADARGDELDERFDDRTDDHIPDRFGAGVGVGVGGGGRPEATGPGGPPPWQDRYYGPPPPTGTPRTSEPQQQSGVQDAPTEQWRTEQWRGQQEPMRQEPMRQEPMRQEPMRQEPMRQEPMRQEPMQRESATPQAETRTLRVLPAEPGPDSAPDLAPDSAPDSAPDPAPDLAPDSERSGDDRDRTGDLGGPQAGLPRREQPRVSRRDAPDVPEITTAPPAQQVMHQPTMRFPRPPDDEDLDPER